MRDCFGPSQKETVATVDITGRSLRDHGDCWALFESSLRDLAMCSCVKGYNVCVVFKKSSRVVHLFEGVLDSCHIYRYVMCASSTLK